MRRPASGSPAPITAAIVAALLLLPGCAATVTGSAQPGVPGWVGGPGTPPAGQSGTPPADPPGSGDGPMREVPRSAPNGDVGVREEPLTQVDKEGRVLDDADVLRGLLDDFWSAELAADGLGFDAPDRYEYYNTRGNSSCGGQDADALPENAYYCFADGDEYVAFDVDWLAGYLDEHPGNATTFLILAHEWGHAVQDTWTEQLPGVHSWDPPYRKELSADCLAGVFLADAFATGTVTEEDGDADAIFGWLFAQGAGEWFDPGDHGTPEQRQVAFSEGFTLGTAHCAVTY